MQEVVQRGVVDSWLQHRKSRKSCLSVLDQFRGFTGCDSYEGLLELADPRRAVLDWRGNLDLAPKSLNVYMSLVKGFYRHFDIDIGVLPQSRNRVVYPHKVLTHDEIRRMLSFAGIRMKALILFLYHSGARIGSTLGLDYGRIDWRGVPPLRVHFFAHETKFEVEYDAFIGVGAVEALKDYFRWRRRRGESLRPDSPLFVSKYGGRISYSGSRSAMKVIIAKADIKMNPNERLTHHSFRGAFQHNLQKAGVNQYIIEKLIGHFTESTTVGRYSLGLTLEDLREAYKIGDWTLDVDEGKIQELEVRVSDTQRVLGSQAVENQKLREVQAVQIQELQNENADMKDKYETILEMLSRYEELKQKDKR